MSNGGIEPLAGHDHSEVLAFVGSRTTRERNARGSGITVWNVPSRGPWSLLHTTAELVNPSFLCMDGQRRMLHTVHGDGATVTTLSIERTGALTLRSSVGSGGLNPVYITLSPQRRFAIVANYASGTIAILPVLSDGSLAEPVHILDLKIKGLEQPSQPHHIVFDPTGKRFLVPDKGQDRVFLFSFDEQVGQANLLSAFGCAPGSGPRHLSFLNDGASIALIEELGSSISSISYDATCGTMTFSQRISTLAPGFSGTNLAAALVALDEEHVILTNRGEDSLAAVSLGRHNKLETISRSGSGGKTPRFCCVGPGRNAVLVANEASDSIELFHFEGRTLLHQMQVARTGSPVSIVLAGKY